MGYGKAVYDAAEARMNERHSRALAECDKRRRAFYDRCPRAAEIENELSSFAILTAKAVLNGGDTKEQLSRLKAKNLRLQQELAALLNTAGFESGALEPKFTCAACADEGFIDGKMCSCFKQLLKDEAVKRLNVMTPLTLSAFSSFSLDFYDAQAGENGLSPRRRMESILRFCRGYADAFSLQSPNLFMQGGTGLGKTHLSLAIARAAIDKGYGAVYGSAQNLTAKLERERFGREPDSESAQLLLECDLLILDDLGAEFSTPFVNAAIYNIINTRIMASLPTIISTNLTLRELEERYTQRLVSRIIGSYTRLNFIGRDVRQQKVMKQGG